MIFSPRQWFDVPAGCQRRSRRGARHVGRWLVVAGIVSLIGGCGAGHANLRRFSGDGLSFVYPPAWHAHSYMVSSGFSTAIVYLSPQRLHPPCVTRHGTHNTTITCHAPVARLQPGSILASWSVNAMPDWRFTGVQGMSLRVGGRPAKLEVTHDTCEIAADELMSVVIAIPASADSWYELNACIKGSGTSQRERQVRQLLRTVRFRA